MATAFSKLSEFLRKHGWFLIMAGVLLIVAGMRLAVTDRASEALPFSDDWFHLEWLRSLTTDQPDYGYPFRYHNEHYYAAVPLVTWLMWKLNGIWDVRLETLVYSLAYIAYAALTMWFFLKTTGGRGRAVLCVLALVFLALPVSGSRAAWGYVSGVTFAMLFGLGAIHLGLNNGGKPLRIALSLICAVLSTGSIAGCGTLISIALGFMLLLRSLRSRTWNKPELFLVGLLGILVAVALLTKPARPDPIVVTADIVFKAFTSSLAWPLVFASPAALVNLLPAVLLFLAWWRKPELRTPAVEAILTVYAFLILQALGIAVFRGENNNMAMPSNRYYDMLQITPFMAVAACLVLLRAWPRQVLPRAASWLLLLTLCGGACIHFFYRMWPYIARENGESLAAAQTNWVRDVLTTGWREPAILADNETNETDVAMGGQKPVLQAWVERKGMDPILPGTLITGHPLEPQTPGPFIAEGYLKNYLARPGFRYWGSYSADRMKATGTFVSEPFTAYGSYLAFDLILSKKARFSFYRLPGCELNVVDTQTGEKINALPGLIKSPPSLFRDREVVTVPVVAGRSYRVEAVDGSPETWFAFSEPADAGRLAPLLFGLNSSGKLLAMLGVVLAAAGIFARIFPAAPSSDPNLVSPQ